MNTYKIKPGYILTDTSSVSGGVHYERQDLSADPINQGRGEDKDYKGRKVVDHLEIVDLGNKIVGRARYILRKYGALTPMGYYVDAQALTEVRVAFDALAPEVSALNARARVENSARRVRIGFVPLPLAIDNEAAAVEIFNTVRTSLTRLRDTFRAGDLKKLPNVVAECRGLHKLACGIQGDAIKFALDTIGERRTLLREALTRGEAPESAGRSLDLDAIESAITLFTPSEDAATLSLVAVA